MIFIKENTVSVLGDITDVAVTTAVGTIGSMALGGIGVTSGVVTLLIAGLQVYGHYDKQKAETEKRSNEISKQLDYKNESYKATAVDNEGVFNSYQEKGDLINEAIMATLVDGKEINLDPVKLAYDIGELMKTGKFATREEAFAFDANMRKTFYNTEMSTPQVDAKVSKVIGMIQNGEELEEEFRGLIPNYQDKDGKKGISVEDLEWNFNEHQADMNRDFKNLEFPPTEKAEIKLNRELLELVKEDIYYENKQNAKDALKWLGFEQEDPNNPDSDYKQIRNFLPKIIDGEVVLVEKLPYGYAYGYEMKEEIHHYGDEGFTKNFKWVNSKSEHRLPHYRRGMMGTLEKNEDSSEIGMFDALIGYASEISDMTMGVRDWLVAGLTPMTVNAATLPSSLSGGGVSSTDGEEEKNTAMVPTRPDYLANGKAAIDAVNSSTVDTGDTELLEQMITMMREHIAEPQYKTINTTVGKDVDLDYVMKEIQRYIDEAFSIMPNVVEKTW